MKSESMFDKVDHIVYSAIKAVSYVSVVFLISITLLAVVNMVLEKLAQLGIPGIHGIPYANVFIQYMNVPVVYLTSAFVTLHRGQTNMDLVTKHYPKFVQRALQVIGSLASAVCLGFIAYLGVVRVLEEQIRLNTRIDSMSAASFPEWPFGLLFVLGMLLLTFSFLWSAVRVIAGHPAVNVELDLDDMRQKILADEQAMQKKKSEQEESK